MEVKGSVIVKEGNGRLMGGFADLGNPIRPCEKDNIPRILVKNFRRNTKPLKLHSTFSYFGTVIYLAVQDQKAVLEFSNRVTVDEILKCKNLRIQGALVDCEPLQKFLHVENNQFQTCLHETLMQLSSREHFEDFVKELCEQSIEGSSQDRERVCQEIERMVRNVYRHCKAYPFGSRVTNLGLQGCDLDIFLDCGNMYNGNSSQDSREQQDLGETVLKQMLRCQDFTRIHKVLHARVPILKFFHSPTNTYGDIAFRNGLGVENSKLLIFLQSLDSRVRPLFLFLKMWARLQNLKSISEHFYFTSYALVMMAVFYLQQLPHPILPPIRKLMEYYKGEEIVIAGWSCGFTQDKDVIPKIKNDSSVFDLATGFFQFYKSFHFEWKIICPYLGKSIEKQEMDEIAISNGDLASLFPVYTQQLEQEDGSVFPTRSPVCIQDPFEHSHNLTRNVKEHIVMNFVSSCGLMYEKLHSCM